MKKKLSLLTLSIGGKLLVGIIAALTFTTIIAVVGIQSINKLVDISNEILDESVEHGAVWKLKHDYQKLQMHTNYYVIHSNKNEIKKFRESLIHLKTNLKKCKNIVEHKEERKFLKKFGDYINKIEQLSIIIFQIENPIENPQSIKIIEEIEKLSEYAGSEIEKTLTITEKEINEYIALKKSTRKKNSIIIISIGLFIAISLLIGGFFYVREITKPIHQLINTTKKISIGDLSAMAEVTTRDEIGNLANSFNSMIGILEKTTVSKDFFKSILNKIAKSIIITNANDEIIIVNKATTDLLKYEEEDIVGKHFSFVLSEKANKKDFKNNDVIQELIKNKHVNNVYNTYYSEYRNKIPVIFSGSLIYNNEGAYNGMICIAYHVDSDYHNERNNHNEEEKANLNTEKTMGDIPLTAREREIIKLITEDYSNLEIAKKLFISVRTVETHRKNIMNKLHAKSVIALVKYASLNGII